MNNADMPQVIVSVLRQTTMIGEREVDPDAPLGEQGLGLDSLALVKFLTALENHFDLELPEDVWIDRQALTLTRLGEAIGISAVPAATAAAAERASAETPNGAGGAAWKIGKIFRLAAGLIYRDETFHILAFDPGRTPNHDHVPAVAVRCRAAETDDLEKAVTMWPPRQRERKRRTFGARVAAGYAAYVGEVEGTIAAIDWVTATEDRERHLGLTIRPRPGGCYGLDLYEHPDWQEKGIGLAVLLYGLRQSAARGCRRQFTVVQSTNHKMLLTCVQLLGFEAIGRIRARRVFGITHSSWQVDGTVGRGRVLEL